MVDIKLMQRNLVGVSKIKELYEWIDVLGEDGTPFIIRETSIEWMSMLNLTCNPHYKWFLIRE